MDLDAKRKALMEMLLAEEGFDADSSVESSGAIKPRDVASPCPLSFAQQRLWFIDQLDPGNPAYNVPGVLDIHGKLNAAELPIAMSRVVERHESLRTRFVDRPDGPMQEVLPPSEATRAFTFTQSDLSHILGYDRESELKHLVHSELNHRFDLANGPLFRLHLIHLEDSHARLLFTLHHIICDGHSLGLIAEELSKAYTIETTDPLKIQLDDYCVWQRSDEAKQAQTNHLKYWTDKLAGIELCELPADRPRPAAPTHHGAKAEFSISEALRQRVEAFARAQNTTPFIVLMAAFKAFVYRHTGLKDLSIGTPVAGRTRAETDALIGFLTNTLVIRSQLELRMSFWAFLDQLKQTTNEAWEHQDVPFEQVVEALSPERSLDRNPLFEILFVFQPKFEASALGDAYMSLLLPEVSSVKFDYTFNLRETDTSYAGWVEYNADIFDSITIEDGCGRFVRLLEGAIERPDTPIAELPLMDAAEWNHTVHTLNTTHQVFDETRWVHDWFSYQAQRTPAAPAIRFEGSSWTYQKLESAANRLAHYFIAHGAVPDVAIGICMERSPQLIVGMMAILKAGSAYLPLDPAYPQDRL